MSPVTFAPGVKDELGTENYQKAGSEKPTPFKEFDRYGNVELHPKRLNSVWVEPQFLKLRARKRKPK